jgi:hypothetical protein
LNQLLPAAAHTAPFASSVQRERGQALHTCVDAVEATLLLSTSIGRAMLIAVRRLQATAVAAASSLRHAQTRSCSSRYTLAVRKGGTNLITPTELDAELRVSPNAACHCPTCPWLAQIVATFATSHDDDGHLVCGSLPAHFLCTCAKIGVCALSRISVALAKHAVLVALSCLEGHRLPPARTLL